MSIDSVRADPRSPVNPEPVPADPVRALFDLTVVVPCYNEGANIGPAYEEIVAELGPELLEVLFVDDGSTDSTLLRLRELAEVDPRVHYVSFTRNFGIEAALGAGYRYASKPWLLHLDADLQFPPKEARLLMERACEGYDAVFGVRVNRADPWLRRASSLVTGFIARRILGIEMPRGATMFRLLRSDLARRVVDLRLGTPYFLATLPRLTSAWTTVATAHRPRLHGRAKMRFPSLARHAMELFISHSQRPLALAAAACLVAGVMAIGAASLVAYSLQLAVALLAVAGAVGLLALAVMGRYLGHIGRSQSRPPLYLIREANIAVDPAEVLGRAPALVGAS